MYIEYKSNPTIIIKTKKKFNCIVSNATILQTQSNEK